MSCLISFVWASPSWEEREASKNVKMKILANTHSPLIMCVQLSFSTKHVAGRTIIIRSPIRVPKICYLQRGLRSRWCCNPWTRWLCFLVPPSVWFSHSFLKKMCKLQIKRSLDVTFLDCFALMFSDVILSRFITSGMGFSPTVDRTVPKIPGNNRIYYMNGKLHLLQLAFKNRNWAKKYNVIATSDDVIWGRYNEGQVLAPNSPLWRHHLQSKAWKTTCIDHTCYFRYSFGHFKIKMILRFWLHFSVSSFRRNQI